jgi:ABC-type multidrug transport system fused ATPase/permease subunit
MSWPRFLWSYLSYRRHLLWMIVVLAAVIAAAELSVPWLIKQAIDAILEENATVDLNEWLFLTLGILLGIYIAYSLMLLLDAHIILQCSYNLRRTIFEHIHAQALPFFARHRTGELLHRLTSDTKIFEGAATKIFRDLPAELFVLVGVVTMMFWLHTGMALLIIIFLVLAAAVAGYLGQPLPTLRKSAQRITARLAARFQEGLSGIRTVQGFHNQKHELARLDKENKSILHFELREGKIYAYMEPLGDLLELLGLVVVVWYGGQLIRADQISVGTLIAFIAYMEIMAQPLGHAEAYYRSAQSSRAVGARLLELLQDCATLPVMGQRALPAKLAISFDHVWFRHHGGDRDIL